jgi:hypothetical protein
MAAANFSLITIPFSLILRHPVLEFCRLVLADEELLG